MPELWRFRQVHNNGREFLMRTSGPSVDLIHSGLERAELLVAVGVVDVVPGRGFGAGRGAFKERPPSDTAM